MRISSCGKVVLQLVERGRGFGEEIGAQLSWRRGKGDEELLGALGEQAEDFVLGAGEVGEAVGDDQLEILEAGASIFSQGVAGRFVRALAIDETVCG